MFNIELYKKNLNNNTVGEILYFNELSSTNIKAFELAKDGAENGTVIITDNQSTGKGRHSNKWYSVPNKSLTFSILLYPNWSIKEINKYSIISGLAVYDALIGYNVQAKLKWPNDVLINNKKVCGILCESKLSGDTVNTLVIGIGLNINESKNDFPEELQQKSTSLFIESGQEKQLELILANILNKMEQRLNHIDKFDSQIAEWESNCAHMNKDVSFKYNNLIIDGIFKGLTISGAARVIVNNKERVFNSGELVTL